MKATRLHAAADFFRRALRSPALTSWRLGAAAAGCLCLLWLPLHACAEPPIRAMTPAIPSLSIVVSSSLPAEAKALLSGSLDEFLRLWGEVPVIVREEDDAALLADAMNGKVDFFFSDAALYAALERFGGSRALLSAGDLRSSNPQQADGLAVLVPAGSLSSSESLSQSWKTLMASARFSAAHDQIPLLGTLLREAAAKHGVSEKALDRISIDSGQPPAGGAPAKLVRACSFEARKADYAGWQVFQPAFSPGLRCLVSAAPIPGPVLGATFRADSAQAELLRSALPASAPAAAWHWMPPADYRTLHERLQQSDSRYQQLARPTPEALWRRFGPYLFAGALFIAVLLGAAFALERRVKHQARQLVATLQAKEASDARFQALERASVVSQMSSIVAHEIRQPLAALRNYVGSLRLRIAKKRLNPDEFSWALGRMSQELERADRIVEHVRSYARRTDAARERLCLSELAAETASAMSVPGLELRIEPHLWIEADRLEVQLIVENLLKNARDAADPQAPRVLLALSKTADRAVLTVEDNGPPISDEALSKISQPLYTTKENGLGLGLAIVRRLAESYGGSAAFTKTPSASLRAVVELPLQHGEPAAQKGGL